MQSNTILKPFAALRRELWLLALLLGAALLLALAYSWPRAATLSAGLPPAALPQAGFHEVERMGRDEEGAAFRWSEGEALLRLPSPGGGPLRLRLLIAAPPAGRAAPLRLSRSRWAPPPFTLSAAPRYYSLLLPPERLNERAELRLETDSFREDLGRKKERRLGLMLIGLDVAAPQGGPPPLRLLGLLLAALAACYALLRRTGQAPRRAALGLLALAAVLAAVQGAWAWQWALSGRLLALVAGGASAALLLDRWLPPVGETRRPGDQETGRPGDRETGRPGDQETGRWGDREMGRPGDGETGRWGDREIPRASLDSLGFEASKSPRLQVSKSRLWGRHDTFTLLFILGLALALRLPLVTAPDPVGDLELAARRAASLAAQGLGGAYSGVGGDDYLPLRLYLLWGMGRLAALLGLGLASPLAPASAYLMKLPWLLADLAVVALLYLWSRHPPLSFIPRISASPRLRVSASPRLRVSASPRLRVSASPSLQVWPALGYAIAPQIVLNAAWWGQVDALLVLLMLVAVLLLVRAAERRDASYVWAWVVIGAALLVKMQALILLPLIGLLTLSVWRAAGLVRGAAALALVLGLGMAPLLLAGQAPGLIEAYLGSVGRFNGVTINAYNIWYFVAPGMYVPDTAMFIAGLGLSYRQAGLGLLGAATLLIGLGAVRRPDPAAWLEAATLQALAFFLLPTQIHERYMYLCFAFLAARLVSAPALWPAFLLLSASATLNIVGTLDFFPALRPLLAPPWVGMSLAVINLLTFALLLAHFIMKATGRRQ